MKPRGPHRLRQDATALLACAGGALDAETLARALQASPADVQALASTDPRGPHAEAGRLVLPDEERDRRLARLPAARRQWAHARLCVVHEDPVARARSACLGGAPPRHALRLVESVLDGGGDDPAARLALLRLAVPLASGARRQRRLRIELAHAAWLAGSTDEAERSLEAAGARRSRDPRARLLLAQIHNRRGRFEAALALTRSLIRGNHHEIGDGELFDLHARNLLLLGRGDEAIRILDARLPRPGPAATLDELNLHLTRERCAREVGVRWGDGSRLLDLARVVREGRRRRTTSVEAQAAWHLGIALSDTGHTERALHWLTHARKAWLARGDLYRAAEIENSIGIFLHKLGRAEEAEETFRVAIERLSSLNERQSLAVVHMNVADLELDRLRLDAARRALAFCRNQVAQGVLRFKSELMTVECHLLAGAAPDLLLDRLAELGSDSDRFDRPAVAAYFHALRGRILRRVGHVRESVRSFERAIALYDRAGNRAAAAEITAWFAALQGDPAAARSAVAGALWRTRRQPPNLVRAVSKVLRGREPDPSAWLPLARERLDEIRAELGRGEGDDTAATLARRELDAMRALARLIARTAPAGPPPDLADFCREELRATGFVLMRRGPVGSFDRIAGTGLDAEHVFVEGRGILTAQEHPASLCIVESDSWLFAFAHDTIELRFGRVEHDLAKQLLALLEERRHAAAGDVPEGRLGFAAAGRARDYEPHGVSPRVRALLRELPALARSELAIVIEGPTGTGKDRLARYVHHLSHRSGGPFVVLDCAALHATLAESELLGHAKGAFTGADQAKAGLLELASAGTLVLDDPAALMPRAQALLLQALEHKSIRRLGEGRTRPIDLRTVAMSRTPLESRIDDGSLRPELYYRLHGTRVVLPALVERIEDLPILISRMIQEENAGRPRAVRREILTQLREELWPGNLSELRNRVRRALLMEPGSYGLGASLLKSGRARGAPEHGAVALAEHMRAEERRVLTEALSHNGGHRERTAQQLGISRRWLQKRIKELGLT